MVDDATRKMLKVFGMAVTDFEDVSRRLQERARGAAGQDLLALAEEAITASAEVNRQWVEMCRHIFEEQARLQAAVAQRLAAAREGAP
jgi:hypothetical protein